MKRAILISESSVYTDKKGALISKGGGEGSFHKLAVALVGLGLETRVFAIREFSEQKAREVIDGVSYVRYPVRSKTSLRIFGYLRAAVREARRGFGGKGADYVFVNQFSPHLVLPFVGRGASGTRKLIAVVHDVYRDKGMSFWIRQFGLVAGMTGAFVERLCLRFDKKYADSILTVSEESKRRILSAFGGKFGKKKGRGAASRACVVVTWPVGGDGEKRAGKPGAGERVGERVLLKDKKDFILFVGRFVDYKNPSHVLHVLKEIKKKWPQYIAVFVVSRVEGKVMKEFTDLRYTLGLTLKDCVVLENVSYDELQRLYKEARLLVHPSFVEGQGMVLAEALAWHTPVVAYDLEAYEGVRAGTRGVKVVSPGEGVHGLVKAVSVVLNDYPKWFNKAVLNDEVGRKKFLAVVKSLL